jgi:hypothetical protein
MYQVALRLTFMLLDDGMRAMPLALFRLPERLQGWSSVCWWRGLRKRAGEEIDGHDANLHQICVDSIRYV